MFVGCGIMIVGPERREDKPRGKRYCGIGITLQRPKFMRRKETLKAISHNNSSSDTLLSSYVNAPKLEWLPEKLPELLPELLPQILNSFEPHDFDFRQLGERYRAIKAEGRDGGRRLNALSVESKMDGKLYESTETVEKE
jgi:hypothetical protein